MTTQTLRGLILGAGLILLASACTTTELTRVGLLHTSAETESDILQQSTRIRAMSPAELSAEAETLQKHYASRRSEERRLQLALFLAIAPTPPGDRARALSLLDLPPNEANGRGRNHPLAQLLLPMLQDLRRLEEAHSGAQQKLRDAQLANDQMRQKLEALRDIELKMQDRPKAK
ncbi:hypothetical protein Q9Q94_08830 [Uliginosibacterium sp. 31-16]|uniref:hypothetical protein n=1 Tax=Uliginosibacterium sp. 31-16 TaxID=3068315 RepID=UPI00273D9B90|nr:hypothetical protein [Uliginosibacterium sp. 31-16]MDP5239632.1 hypothetical protein [Uliginosibacterium sp. 31-16]